MDEEKVSLSSRKKWFWLAIVIAIISPVSGAVLGIAFLTEPDLKKEGKFIFFISVILGIAIILLSKWLYSKGYLNQAGYLAI
jgi:hypothetical protein